MPWIYLELNGCQLRIDSEDALNIYSWRDWVKTPYWFKIKPTLSIHHKNGYKSYNINIKKKGYILSRVFYKAHNPDWDLTDISSSNQIDHINIDSVDNRIENLRILTSKQNLRNTSAKGYSWDKHNNVYRAEITVDLKKINLGSFTEEADARQAYLTAKEKYHIMPT